jgi:hypothetical protein
VEIYYIIIIVIQEEGFYVYNMHNKKRNTLVALYPCEARSSL